MSRTHTDGLCALCRKEREKTGEAWGDLCAGCADLISEFLDTLDLTDADADVLIEFVDRANRRIRPWRRKMRVPTYYGNVPPDVNVAGLLPEFGEPIVPVLVQRADGVRLILGTHELSDTTKPDIAVERRPNGWAIFLHPFGGGDPCGYVYFLDDGRSFLLPELGVTPAIELVKTLEDVAEVDRPARSR